ARVAVADRQYLHHRGSGAAEGTLARLMRVIFGPAGRGARKDRPAEEMFRTVMLRPLHWSHGYAIINPGVRDETIACAIQVDPGWTVTGKVVGPDGKPVAGT